MKGSEVIIFNIYHISFSVLAKIPYPDEMPHYAAFYLEFYCLLKYPGTQRVKIVLFKIFILHICYISVKKTKIALVRLYIENTR